MVSNSPGTTVDRNAIEKLVRQVLRDQLIGKAIAGNAPTVSAPTSSISTPPHPLRVNVSARHVHVTQQHLEILFGAGSKLTKLKDLYQDGEFASEQLVNIIGPRSRMIPAVRILGPTRNYTQVELSYTDGIFLGIELALKTSGDHKDTHGCVLVGPKGAIALESGVIRAERHVHMHPTDCAYYGVKDGDYMKLRIEGPCGMTFERVKVREHPKVKLEVHIDTDEGNACDLRTATKMELIK